MDSKSLKYIELAKVLRERIARGRWKGVLPGVQRLAEEFGCHARTMQRATDLLVAEGVLHRPNRRRTYVTPDGVASGSRERHVRQETIHIYNCYWGPGQPTSPYLAAVYGGIRRAAKRHGVSALIESGVEPDQQTAHPKQVRRYIETLAEDSWLIIMGSGVEDEIRTAIRGRRIHAVFVDPWMRSLLPCNTVMSDWHQGMVELVETLRTFGHSRIALIGARTAGLIDQGIPDGFRAGILRMKLRPEECPFIVGESGVPELEQLETLLSERPHPTALISKTAAYRDIRTAARRAGLRIPKHLSVVMLGTASKVMTSPRIARLCCDQRLLGRVAVDTLFQTANLPANVHVQLRMRLRRGDSIHRPAEGRGQGSGVRDQGSGVRGQGSGVRGQGSGVRGQGSGVRGQGGRTLSVPD